MIRRQFRLANFTGYLAGFIHVLQKLKSYQEAMLLPLVLTRQPRQAQIQVGVTTSLAGISLSLLSTTRFLRQRLVINISMAIYLCLEEEVRRTKFFCQVQLEVLVLFLSNFTCNNTSCTSPVLKKKKLIYK